MKFIVASLLISSAAAFNSFAPKKAVQAVVPSYNVEDLPGILAPVGFFDPLGFAAKADEGTLKRYREAELAHGRVSMLAVLGFLVGEQVEGSSFLFDASIKGPAITHLPQVPAIFWGALTVAIGAIELYRADIGWEDPADTPFDQPGLLKEDYSPGSLNFDPLSLMPEDPEEFKIMATKELQHGRLAMLAAAGFLAQEKVDGMGIIQHLQSM